MEREFALRSLNEIYDGIMSFSAQIEMTSFLLYARFLPELSENANFVIQQNNIKILLYARMVPEVYNE